MVKYAKIQGFTLIEILIAVAIFIAVLAQTLPMAQSWYNTLAITETKGQIKTAISRAKHTSQLNQQGNTLMEPNSAVCVGNGAISVRTASETEVAGCDNPDLPEIWSSTLPPRVALSRDGVDGVEPFTCLCFRPSGFGSTDFSCSSCPATSELMIKIDDREETISLL